MKRRLLYGSLLTCLTLNLLVGFKVYSLAAQAEGEDNNPHAQYQVFTQVVELIRKHYVDGSHVSYEDLIRGALRGMVQTLDPHSEFMEPRKFEDLRDDTEGEFGGLGVVVSVRDNILTVVAPMEDTPGFKAGLRSGDRIVRIDGKSSEGMSLTEAVRRLRGKPGTDVELTVAREGVPEPIEVSVTRAVIKVDTVKDLKGGRTFEIGPHGIGYVRITQFGEQTSDELERGLKRLEKQGMEGLVMDLRNNPGGLLDQAVKVCDKFLPRGQLVVYTEGREGRDRMQYRSEGRKDQGSYPIVILVNGGSASASEIVSGCLQDLNRALILGEQTFGKGSVQSILPLDNGSALRLTTAKYYTPSRKTIHERGITPDIIVPMSDEHLANLLLKRSPGGLEGLPEAQRARIESVSDVQLDRAVDLLRGLHLLGERKNPKPGKVARKQ